MKQIPLTRDKFAIVDDEDFEELNKHKWHLNKGDLLYAARAIIVENNKTKGLKMHRAIMNPPIGMEVDHINGNGLDNRRCNLRIVTSRENHHNIHGVLQTSQIS